MSRSTASTGSKRRAVDEDESPHHTDGTRELKRLKPAEKTPFNDERNISKYFTRIGNKDNKTSLSCDSDDRINQTSPEEGSAKSVSQRKDASISPPNSSRSKKSAASANPEQNRVTTRIASLKEAVNDKNKLSSLEITEQIGDIFNAPADTLLIHACNCKGWWGKGIAAAFKQAYPAAFKIYQSHCKKTPDKQLIGTALLIPPQYKDRHQHYVGCVFTSAATGKWKAFSDGSILQCNNTKGDGNGFAISICFQQIWGGDVYRFRVDPPQKILKATGPAMTDLLTQARNYISSGEGNISNIRICKINSGLFKVKWEDTLEVLKIEVEPHGFKSMEVFSVSGS